MSSQSSSSSSSIDSNLYAPPALPNQSNEPYTHHDDMEPIMHPMYGIAAMRNEYVPKPLGYRNPLRSMDWQHVYAHKQFNGVPCEHCQRLAAKRDIEPRVAEVLADLYPSDKDHSAVLQSSLYLMCKKLKKLLHNYCGDSIYVFLVRFMSGNVCPCVAHMYAKLIDSQYDPRNCDIINPYLINCYGIYRLIASMYCDSWLSVHISDALLLPGGRTHHENSILIGSVKATTEHIHKMYEKKGYEWDGYFRFVNISHPLFMAFTGAVPIKAETFEGLVKPTSIRDGEKIKEWLANHSASKGWSTVEEGVFRTIRDKSGIGDEKIDNTFDTIGFQKRDLRKAILKVVRSKQQYIKYSQIDEVPLPGRVDVKDVGNLKSILNVQLLTGIEGDENIPLPGFYLDFNSEPIPDKKDKDEEDDEDEGGRDFEFERVYRIGKRLPKTYYELIYRTLYQTLNLAPIESLQLANIPNIEAGIQNAEEKGMAVVANHQLITENIFGINWYTNVYNHHTPYIRIGFNKGVLARVPRRLTDFGLDDPVSLYNKLSIELSNATVEGLIYICQRLGVNVRDHTGGLLISKNQLLGRLRKQFEKELDKLDEELANIEIN